VHRLIGGHRKPALSWQPEGGTMDVRTVGIFAGLAWLTACAAAAGASYDVVTKGDGWIYTRLGNQRDLQTKTSGGIVFEGGGLDVNEAYQWMCKRGGYGDFLVIRTYGTADYNPYIAHLCPGINSVSTLLMTKPRASNDPFVLAALTHAEAIFIAGGDQSSYVKLWQGTPLNTELNAAAARGVPVGGTSAGNAILAQFAFSALYGTVLSKGALADCFNKRITIDEGFLNVNPLLAATITDDHFVTRNRMGRLVTFLARIVQSGAAAEAFGIALDEHTAFLMEPGGAGRVVGGSTVYFLRTPGPPETCVPANPVTFTDIPVYRVSRGNTFDIANWQGSGGTAYTVSATNGVLSASKGKRIY
jgi:cyanophycinase